MIPKLIELDNVAIGAVIKNPLAIKINCFFINTYSLKSYLQLSVFITSFIDFLIL